MASPRLKACARYAEPRCSESVKHRTLEEGTNTGRRLGVHVWTPSLICCPLHKMDDCAKSGGTRRNSLVVEAVCRHCPRSPFFSLISADIDTKIPFTLRMITVDSQFTSLLYFAFLDDRGCLMFSCAEGDNHPLRISATACLGASEEIKRRGGGEFRLPLFPLVT
jgi:hypothetical protein